MYIPLRWNRSMTVGDSVTPMESRRRRIRPFLSVCLLHLRHCRPARHFGRGRCWRRSRLGYVLVATWRLTSSRLSAQARRLVCGAIIASAPVYWHFFFSQCQLLIAAMILMAYSCSAKREAGSGLSGDRHGGMAEDFSRRAGSMVSLARVRDWKTRWKCAGAALAWSVGIVLAAGWELGSSSGRRA